MTSQARARWRPAKAAAGPALFLLIVSAVMGQGPRRPLLAFVRADDLDEALSRGREALAARHWEAVDLQGARRLADAEEADPVAREAMARAADTGFAMLAY